jgi:hypothetical protein
VRPLEPGKVLEVSTLADRDEGDLGEEGLSAGGLMFLAHRTALLVEPVLG